MYSSSGMLPPNEWNVSLFRGGVHWTQKTILVLIVACSWVDMAAAAICSCGVVLVVQVANTRQHAHARLGCGDSLVLPPDAAVVPFPWRRR